jgi:hypothetical protein
VHQGPQNADENHKFQRSIKTDKSSVREARIKTARVRFSHSQAALERVLPRHAKGLTSPNPRAHYYYRLIKSRRLSPAAKSWEETPKEGGVITDRQNNIALQHGFRPV